MIETETNPTIGQAIEMPIWTDVEPSDVGGSHGAQVARRLVLFSIAAIVAAVVWFFVTAVNEARVEREGFRFD